jgi:fluoride ion exporter CrcB/FEX
MFRVWKISDCFLFDIDFRSFTTFSTFSFDVVTWISEGKTARALSYVAANNVCSVAAAGVGMMAVKKILAKA